MILPALFSLIFYTLKFAFHPEKYNYLTTVYAVFLIIWAQFYLIDWKRKCSELMIQWDNFNEEYDKENQKKDFIGTWGISPITGKPEKQYPNSKRLIKILQGILFMFPVFIIATLMNTIFMNLDGTIQDDTLLWIPFFSQFSKEGQIFSSSSILINFLPIIQAQCINFMNRQFRKVAVWTTDRENHSNKSNYENTIILKRYIFEFMDNYMCFFYIAFFNQDFTALKTSIVSFKF